MSLIRKCDICNNKIAEPTFVRLSAVRKPSNDSTFNKTESNDQNEFLYGIDICHLCHEKIRLYAINTIQKESMLESSRKIIHDLDSDS